MPSLPKLSAMEIIKILNRFGFEEIRQKGSHRILKKQTTEQSVGCVVPMHKEVAIGTLKNILKQAQISETAFLDACKK